MDFLDVIHKRHSIRQFEPKEIEAEKLESLLKIINNAPSAGDLQSFELVVVKDRAHRKALAHAALGQEFIQEAPVVLVFCANPGRARKQYGRRGESLYSIQDATIAATYAQLAAVELELSTVWVGAFDEDAVKDVVGALKPVCIMPIGYPAETPIITPRRPIEDIVHDEHL
ncbi:MAG: nitroreductase family protein [Bacteriovorax sp.]|jgi:nitroreductase